MKTFRKLSAIFLSLALLAAVCVPLGVSAASNLPPIRVSITDAGTFSSGDDVALPITVENIGNGNLTITAVSIEKNNSFTAGSATVSSESLAPTAKLTWNVATRYQGRGQSAKISIKVDGYDLYTTSIAVPGATPSQNNGGNTNRDPEDAKPFIYAANHTTFRAGDASAFPLTVATNSGYSAENVRITVSSEDENAKDGFAFQENNGSFILDYLEDQQEITPTLVVSPSVPDGNYTLTLNFRYEDYAGNSFQSSDTVRVTVRGKSMSSVYVKSAKLDRVEIDKENKAKLTVEIVNPTQKNYNDLTVAMNTKDSKITLYENFQPVRLFAIDAGATSKAAFLIYADSSVTTGNYPVTFDVSYTGTDGTVYSSQETIYVLITRTADIDNNKDSSKPRIIIQSYKTSVETIEAGKSFNLDFTLQNTSADTDVTNVKVVLGSEEASTNTATGGKTNNNVFFPSEGSNSFFIEKIAPKGSVSNSITLTTSQDVEPGVYSLTLGIEYDANGTAVSPSEEKLAFPVAQQQRLDIQGFSVEGNTMLGSSVPVTFQYINKGKATIYNFSVDVEGDFTLEDTTMSYIGNLTSGYNDTYENYLVPQKEGQCAGAILFKYEDSQGVEKVEKKEFTVNVQSMDMPTGGDMGGMIGGGMVDPETGFPLDPESGLPLDPDTGLPIQKGGVLPIVIGCVAAVVVIGGAVTFVVLRKKKKAKELVEDEED